MADYLTTALSGLGTTTNETPWGTVGQILLEQSPYLINKQRPSGGNLAAAFGTALLGGLIKYKGRQDAAEQTAEAASLAQQIHSAKTPEERLAIAQSAESGNVRNKLTGLVNALTTQDVANARDIAQKKAEMIAGYEAEMSPLGQALANRKQAQRIAEINALYNRKEDLQDNKPPKAVTLPSGVQDRIVDATTFVDSAKAHRNRIASISPAKLKTMLTTGVNFGEEGFNQENEAVVQLYRKANFGATLTGQEKKAADIITGKNLLATKQDILAAWDILIKASSNRAKKTIEVATQGPAGLLESLESNVPAETEAQKRNRELKERLANLERQAAGQGN